MDFKKARKKIDEQISALDEKKKKLLAYLEMLNDLEGKSMSSLTDPEESSYTKAKKKAVQKPTTRTRENSSEELLSVLKKSSRALSSAEIREGYAKIMGKNPDDERIKQFIDSTLNVLVTKKKTVERFKNPNGKWSVYKIKAA